MANMSYCRFTNTRIDLGDCLDSIRRDERLSDFEAQNGRMMFLEFLNFCRDYDLIDQYDKEAVDDLLQGLQEREEEGWN